MADYANPVYGVATICHQVRWVRWGHPSPFHKATSLLIWYKMFCVRDISYRLIWMEFINMFSVYAQSGTHSRFNWWVIVVLTYNPSVLMCVEITDAPNSSGNVYKHGHLLWFQVSGRWGKISGVRVIDCRFTPIMAVRIQFTLLFCSLQSTIMVAFLRMTASNILNILEWLQLSPSMTISDTSKVLMQLYTGSGFNLTITNSFPFVAGMP